MFIIIVLRFTRIFSEKDVKNMKIEKVNDNQIRCTLTREDLEDRHIKISELAYGSAKAKSLFKDMVEQANYEFGFETNDIPLMVEAIPLPSESIVLIITKVEYPDELDTRFSKFSEADDDFTDLGNAGQPPVIKGAADILELFERIKKENEKTADSEKSTDDITEEQAEVDHAVSFVFDKFDDASMISYADGFYSYEMTIQGCFKQCPFVACQRVSILQRNSTKSNIILYLHPNHMLTMKCIFQGNVM